MQLKIAYFSPMYFYFPVDYTISVYRMTNLHLLRIHLLQSVYLAGLFLINWNEKQCSKYIIPTMDQKSVLENSSSTAVYAIPNTIIYLKVVQYLNIRLRQIHLTNFKLKIRVQKIVDRILCYGCKDSRLLHWKLKCCGSGWSGIMVCMGGW